MIGNMDPGNWGLFHPGDLVTILRDGEVMQCIVADEPCMEAGRLVIDLIPEPTDSEGRPA